MPVLLPKYFAILRDASTAEASVMFRAVDDQAALYVATKIAERSKAKMIHFFKVAIAFEVPTHEPVAGSNVRSKAWMYYQAESSKGIKLSIPAFDESFFQAPQRTIDSDLLGGVGRLVTRAGSTAVAFVRGVWLYGLRASDGA